MQKKLDAHLKSQTTLTASIQAKFDSIAVEYTETGSFLRKFIKDFIKTKLENTDGTIALTLVDIQNEFILKAFPLYTPGAENTILSNMALLDVIIELVTEDAQLAERFEIITTQKAPLLQRPATDKDAQLMAASAIGAEATKAALAIEQVELQDKNTKANKYGLHCLRNTIGAAIPVLIESRLEQLALLEVKVTRFGKVNSSAATAMLLKSGINLNKLKNETYIYDDSATSFVSYMQQDNKFSSVVVTGFGGELNVQETAETMTILGENVVTVLDPCVHYPLYPGKIYNDSRKQATASYEAKKIGYQTSSLFRSNPELILGYKGAITFYAKTALNSKANAIKAMEDLTDEDKLEFVKLANKNFNAFIATEDLSLAKRLITLKRTMLNDLQALIANYPHDNKFKAEMIAYVDLINTELPEDMLIANLKPDHFNAQAALTAGAQKEYSKISSDYEHTGLLLKLTLSRMLFELFHETKGPILLTMIDMQSDFLINGFPAYLNNSENVVISNIALMDALLELLDNDDEGLVTSDRIQIAMIMDTCTEYPFYCVPGTAGVTAPRPINDRLYRLKGYDVSITNFAREKGAQLSTAKQLNENLDIGNAQFQRNLDGLYARPDSSYTDFIKSNSFGTNMITGVCQPSALIELTQDLTEENQCATVVDPCVFYPVDNAEVYESSRSLIDTAIQEQNQKLGKEVISYCEYTNYRSNPELIEGYKDAFKFYKSSGLLFTMTRILNDIDDTISETLNPEDPIIQTLKSLRIGLHTALTQDLLTTNGLNLETRKLNFKTHSLAAIQTAREALPKHPEWRRKLFVFASVLVSFLTLGILNYYTNKDIFTLFSLPRINNTQIYALNNMEEAVNTVFAPPTN